MEYEKLHKIVLTIVREDAVCRRLMTVPSVGPLVAIICNNLQIRNGRSQPRRQVKGGRRAVRAQAENQCEQRFRYSSFGSHFSCRVLNTSAICWPSSEFKSILSNPSSTLSYSGTELLFESVNLGGERSDCVGVLLLHRLLSFVVQLS